MQKERDYCRATSYMIPHRPAVHIHRHHQAVRVDCWCCIAFENQRHKRCPEITNPCVQNQMLLGAHKIHEDFFHFLLAHWVDKCRAEMCSFALQPKKHPDQSSVCWIVHDEMCYCYFLYKHSPMIEEQECKLEFFLPGSFCYNLYMGKLEATVGIYSSYFL